jgi:hypothetical protein
MHEWRTAHAEDIIPISRGLMDVIVNRVHKINAICCCAPKKEGA